MHFLYYFITITLCFTFIILPQALCTQQISYKVLDLKLANYQNFWLAQNERMNRAETGLKKSVPHKK